MKSILLGVVFCLPFFVASQELPKQEVAQLYIEALQDFESSPLKLHKMDSKILVAKPDCGNTNLPSKIGGSIVEWFCFDQDLAQQLHGNLEKHNGRSVVLTSHSRPSLDTVIVRVDQWTLGNIGNRATFIPINEDSHPEYKNKNHDYVFIKINSNWKLIKKVNTLESPTEKDQEIEEIFQKGNSLSREGRYKEALEHVERSMAMDSSLYQRYIFRAELKEKLGMYESAISDVTKAIDRCNCTNRKFHVSSYLLRRSSLHEQNNDFDLAMADVSASILSNPEKWESYLYRGQLLAKSQKFDEALNDLNKAAEINDNEAAILVSRGLVYAKLGDMKKACLDIRIVAGWGNEDAKKWVKANCK